MYRILKQQTQREQTSGYQWGGGRKEEQEIQTTIYKIHKHQEYIIQYMEIIAIIS